MFSSLQGSFIEWFGRTDRKYVWWITKHRNGRLVSKKYLAFSHLLLLCSGRKELTKVWPKWIYFYSFLAAPRPILRGHLKGCILFYPTYITQLLILKFNVSKKLIKRLYLWAGPSIEQTFNEEPYNFCWTKLFCKLLDFFAVRFKFRFVLCWESIKVVIGGYLKIIVFSFVTDSPNRFC